MVFPYHSGKINTLPHLHRYLLGPVVDHTCKFRQSLTVYLPGVDVKKFDAAFRISKGRLETLTLTAMIYAIVAKVVRPARISV